jgi:hypothetical protein
VRQAYGARYEACGIVLAVSHCGVHLLSLDPGRAYCGWGLFQESHLVHAGVSALPEAMKYLTTGQVASYHLSAIVRATAVDECDRVVAELMQLTLGRDGTLGKAIAVGNDLIGLSTIAAYIAGAMHGALELAPHPKCSKDVTKARVLYVLTDGEKAAMQRGLGKRMDQTVGLNAFDAVFHGLRAVGRFGR